MFKFSASRGTSERVCWMCARLLKCELGAYLCAHGGGEEGSLAQ